MVRLGIRAARFRALIPRGTLLFFISVSAFGQSPAQQYVCANVPGTPPSSSTLAAYAKNGQTGSLGSVPSAPLSDRQERGRLAVDALGRFLFVLNPTTGGISMFQIDSSTRALTEVPSSPFSSGKTINLARQHSNNSADRHGNCTFPFDLICSGQHHLQSDFSGRCGRASDISGNEYRLRRVPHFKRGPGRRKSPRFFPNH